MLLSEKTDLLRGLSPNIKYTRVATTHRKIKNQQKDQAYRQAVIVSLMDHLTSKTKPACFILDLNSCRFYYFVDFCFFFLSSPSDTALV